MGEGITSPPGVLMLFIAGLLDLIGLAIALLIFFFGIGIILAWIWDIICILIIGSWMLTRHMFGESKNSKGTEEQEEDENDTKQEEENKEEQKEEPQKQKNAQPENTEPKKESSENAPSKEKSNKEKGREYLQERSEKKLGVGSAKDIANAVKSGDVKELAKKATKRFIWTAIIKAIPIIGYIYPAWTIFVYRELKD